MKNLIILTNQTDLPDSSIVIAGLIVIFIAIMLYAIYAYRKHIRDNAIRWPESIIVEPDKTLQLQELPIGKTLMVLKIDRDLPVVQYTEDYQEGMITNMFANTFYLKNFGESKLERLKTYNIESIGKGEVRVLEQVAIMF